MPCYRLRCGPCSEPSQGHRRGAKIDRRRVARPNAEPERGRYDGQECVVRRQQAIGDGLLVKEIPPVLGVYHTFGQAGGPGRRVDEKNVVGADVTVAPPAREASRRYRRRSGEIVIEDVRGDRARVRRGPRRGAGALPIADQKLRPRTPQDRSDLASAGTRADANHDGTAALDCDEQRMDRRGVTVPYAHPVTAPNAEAAQLLSESRC